MKKINVKTSYFKPFGPGILKGELPKELLKSFKELSDKVLDEKRKEHNYALAGKIFDEWKIPELLYRDYGLADFLDDAFKAYLKSLHDDMLMLRNLQCHEIQLPEYEFKLKRGDGWINSMKQGEYNPSHVHTNCDLSSIFYLNDYCGDEPIDNKRDDPWPLDGSTTLIGGSQVNGNVLNKRASGRVEVSPGIPSLAQVDIKPATGHFYIFQ
mgnify:FL=1